MTLKTNYMYIDREVNSLCWEDLLLRSTSYFTSFYCHYLAGSDYHASPCSEYCYQFYQSRARPSLESFDFGNPWKPHPLTRLSWETLLLRPFDYWLQIWNQECYFQAIFKQLWDWWKGYFVRPRKWRQATRRKLYWANGHHHFFSWLHNCVHSLCPMD